MDCKGMDASTEKKRIRKQKLRFTGVEVRVSIVGLTSMLEASEMKMLSNIEEETKEDRIRNEK